MRLTPIYAAVFLMLAGCATPPEAPSDILPAQAVIAAASEPVTGTFRVTVQAAGRQDGRLYLNSERDYRDQRCLTISIPDALALELQSRLGGDPATVLKHRTLRVDGTARRVTIWFYSNGVRTDRYYYQTHVLVSDLAQIQILDE